MAIYTILRVYEVPANNRYEAADRMREALELHTEKAYHVTDVVREKDAKPGQGKAIDLRPPTNWLRLIVEQLIG